MWRGKNTLHSNSPLHRVDNGHSELQGKERGEPYSDGVIREQIYIGNYPPGASVLTVGLLGRFLLRVNSVC